MRLALDAHAVLWAVDHPSKLSATASAALQDPGNELLLSAATIWETGIKVGLGKLKLAMPFQTWMNQTIAALGLAIVPITVEYADIQAPLPFHHRDPFDRMLAAQAIADQLQIVSADSIFDSYGVKRIW